MNKAEKRFFESCRIKIAKELEIPPDDIDIYSIVSCCKRAIIEQCGSKDDNGPIINPLTDEEKEIIFSEYGSIIISKIFAGEAPFYSWVEKFEDDYARAFLERINRKNEF